MEAVNDTQTTEILEDEVTVVDPVGFIPCISNEHFEEHWKQSIIDIIRSQPNSTVINWIIYKNLSMINEFIRYLMNRHSTIVYSSYADTKHVTRIAFNTDWNTKDTLIIQLHSANDMIDIFNIRRLKSGIFEDPKVFCGEVKLYTPPHVFIFSPGFNNKTVDREKHININYYLIENNMLMRYNVLRRDTEGPYDFGVNDLDYPETIGYDDIYSHIIRPPRRNRSSGCIVS